MAVRACLAIFSIVLASPGAHAASGQFTSAPPPVVTPLAPVAPPPPISAHYTPSAEVQAPPEVDSRYTRAEPATLVSKKKWRAFVSMSFVSWQESINLLNSDGKTYPLKANNIGACPGMDFISVFSPRFALQFGGCILLVSSQVSNATGTTPAVSYQSLGTQAQGLLTSTGILWTPANSERSRYGVSIPILLRSANWPNAPGGADLSTNNTAVMAGVWFEGQFDLGRFMISPKTGFIQSTGNFSWNLQLAYNFN